MTYDPDGNLTSDGGHSYTWSPRNLLASIDGGNTASFVYGPFGRRISKTVYGSTTGYLYDGPNVVQELSGNTPSANLLTGGLDEVFTRTDSSGSYSFLRDGLGSTLALTDSTGAVQESYTYSPYGITSANGNLSSNSYQYTGRETDATGIYFYRARYYNPTTARFLSEDPAGFGGSGPNLYNYAGNSPTNVTDPLGESQFYGNWCGPDWTGRRKAPYDPRLDTPYTVEVNPLTYQIGISPSPYYSPPVDGLDAACEAHDKCYYRCRAKYKCDKGGRKSCMASCNRTLANDAWNSGGPIDAELEIMAAMKFISPSDDLVGPNDLSCKYNGAK